MFWAVHLPIIRSFPLYIRHWYMSCRSDDSFQARLSWSCLKVVIKPAWHKTVPNVQWEIPDDGQENCPKHVDFLDKNKFGKLVGLLVLLKINLSISFFTIRDFRTSSPYNWSLRRSEMLRDLTLADRNVRLSRNFGNKLKTSAA